MEHGEKTVKIWSSGQVPEQLKAFCEESDWASLIPSGLECPELEEFFFRWRSKQRRITRQILADGSILFSIKEMEQR